MTAHKHTFVEDYNGLVGFGFDRPTDEATVKVYLQKFSDDDLLETIIPRLTDEELANLFDQLCGLLARRLEEPEYHALFLK